MRRSIGIAALAGCVLAGLWAAQGALGNGGPFVVKYPSGDPAAKGVLARLDASLKPARETRLRVVKEDLSVAFGRGSFPRPDAGPLAEVIAAYTIENPTDDEVQVDFGFPILRGIYMSPWSMMPTPDVRVTADAENLKATIISNSVIYGLIRQQAREAIERGIAADTELASRVAAVRDALANLRRTEAGEDNAPPRPAPRQAAAQAQQARASEQTAGASPGMRRLGPRSEELARRKLFLRQYLGEKKWQDRDAALLVEYATLDFGAPPRHPFDRWEYWSSLRSEAKYLELVQGNLGPLAAIGEQKATHLSAQLAACFDRDASAGYEAIFAAWGGDVRERSIDLNTGKLRPRKLDAPADATAAVRSGALGADPTVYARVDYLDPNAKLSESEKAACQAILKNLPVTFTFAPMNLLHYEVRFPARATRVVTIKYKQYAYVDTGEPASYQLAYVLHPATLWDRFGPINLKVKLPKGIACRASVAMAAVVSKSAEPVAGAAAKRVGVDELALGAETTDFQATLTELKDKSGELFLGIDKAAWDEFMRKEAERLKDKERVSPVGP